MSGVRTIGVGVVVIGLVVAAPVVIGLLPLVAAVVVMIAGIRRLSGRDRTPIDRVADVSSRAVARSIYPPSLRGGGPDVPVRRGRPMVRPRRGARR